ncbi:NADH-quinone oxidoreductase subunit M [uncultured Nevskia sp.]|uniref:NADH-quinone oxidoreductase subunit M n=1 Tax=uncultured Nevskia sp. TaxID=228950 RepID=UPI0025E5E6D7|nr:NADH-quinone oxidoreductase subunit M [uncultured Nevskia sp.]
MILVWLLAIPFIGGFLCWQGERFGRGFPRWVGLITMSTVLAISLYLWVTGDYSQTLLNTSNPHWVEEFRADWIPRLGISFHLALDGLSLVLIVLTGLIGVIAIACSWNEVQRNVGFFHLNLLWNLAGVIGVFLAMDLFLFFFFWEMMLVPMYFLIALWGHNAPGGKGRVFAATKFFIFTQASGLLMLLAILALVFAHYAATDVLTFGYPELLTWTRSGAMSAQLEWWLMLGFFVAFAVKMPVVPLHSWLPDAHSQAPTAGSVDLAGILLKTAAYGILRFGVPFFPNASHQIAPFAMWLGVAGVIYGAVLSLSQHDVKRFVAYTSVSHMGFVLIGIYSGTEQSLQGVVIQMLAHGISAGALFILCGEVYERLHTRDLREMGGLWSRLPFLPPIAMFFSAAALGLPGLGNFIGEFLILVGSFPVNPVVTIVSASGLILAAVYSLMMMQRAFFGPPKSEEKLRDLNAREMTTMLSLMALILFMGLYPQPILDVTKATMAGVQAVYATGLPVSATAMIGVQP